MYPVGNESSFAANAHFNEEKMWQNLKRDPTKNKTPTYFHSTYFHVTLL